MGMDSSSRAGALVRAHSLMLVASLHAVSGFSAHGLTGRDGTPFRSLNLLIVEAPQ